jgi:fucose 4-O-acetylase-like acetyltransferase
MKNEHIKWIDILKGIGIILVVIFHFSDINLLDLWVLSFCMPLFFFASGYLYKKKPIVENFTHKFRTIVVPYICFGLITSAWSIINDIYFHREFSVTGYLIGLLKANYSGIIYNRELWFLPSLFVTINLYNIFMNLFGKKLTYIIVLIFMLARLLGWMPMIGIWEIGSAIYYIFFYMAGNFFAENISIDKFRESEQWKKLLLVLASLIITVVMAYYGMSDKAMKYITSIIGILGCISFSLIIEARSRVLVMVGQSSLCILCIHIPIGEVLDKVLVRFTPMTFDTGKTQLGWVSIRFVIVIGICVFANRIIMKFFPWILGKYNVTHK